MGGYYRLQVDAVGLVLEDPQLPETRQGASDFYLVVVLDFQDL